MHTTGLKLQTKCLYLKRRNRSKRWLDWNYLALISGDDIWKVLFRFLCFFRWQYSRCRFFSIWSWIFVETETLVKHRFLCVSHAAFWQFHWFTGIYWSTMSASVHFWMKCKTWRINIVSEACCGTDEAHWYWSFLSSVSSFTADVSVAHEMLYERTRWKVGFVLKIERRVLLSIPTLFLMPILYAAYHASMGTYDVEDSWIFICPFWCVEPSLERQFVDLICFRWFTGHHLSWIPPCDASW